MLPTVEVTCERVYKAPTPVAKEAHQKLHEIIAPTNLPATQHHNRHGNTMTQKDCHTL